jgi:hypothetical protein
MAMASRSMRGLMALQASRQGGTHVMPLRDPLSPINHPANKRHVTDNRMMAC